ncbi:MAG: hypothetical protein IH945_02985 [Armatimonadetes bacterium]|nr:hypothetical protein [Armatimonadota bacterium]
MAYKRYRKALRSVRATAPTTGIDVVYACYGASNRPVKRIKRAILYSGLAAVPVLVAVASLLLLRPAKAVTLENLISLMEDAPAKHAVWKSELNDRKQEEWSKGEMTRVHVRYSTDSLYANMSPGNAEFERGYDGKRSWVFYHSRGYGEVRTGKTNFSDSNIQTLEETIAYLRKTAHSEPTITDGTIDGVKRFTVSGKGRGGNYDPYRVVIEVDSEMRPVRQEFFKKDERGAWKLTGTWTIDYPDDMPDSVFKFSPPPGIVMSDFDRTLAKFQRALDGGGQSKTVKGIKITILGAIHNRRGKTWLLWKGGAVPPLFASAAVRDQAGDQKTVRFLFEDDDRTRKRNYGVPPKVKPKPIPREDQVRILRPLGFHEGEPYYGIVFLGGPDKPSPTLTFNVVLPVCEEAEPYIQQPDNFVKHKAFGKQVGIVDFRVQSDFVAGLWDVIMAIDPEHFPVFGSYPVKNMGLPHKQAADLIREHLRLNFALSEGGS